MPTGIENFDPPAETRMETVGAYTYIGEAEPGSADTDPVWRIHRVSSTAIRWANKRAKFENVWESSPGNADYATYTYV